MKSKRRFIIFLLFLIIFTFSSCKNNEKVMVLSSSVGIEAFTSKAFITLSFDSINKVSKENEIEKEDVSSYLFENASITKVTPEVFLSREELYKSLYSIVGSDDKVRVLYEGRDLLKKSDFLPSLEKNIPSYDKALFEMSKKRSGDVTHYSDLSFKKGDNYSLFLKSWINAILNLDK